MATFPRLILKSFTPPIQRHTTLPLSVLFLRYLRSLPAAAIARVVWLSSANSSSAKVAGQNIPSCMTACGQENNLTPNILLHYAKEGRPPSWYLHTKLASYPLSRALIAFCYSPSLATCPTSPKLLKQGAPAYY